MKEMSGGNGFIFTCLLNVVYKPSIWEVLVRNLAIIVIFSFIAWLLYTKYKNKYEGEIRQLQSEVEDLEEELEKKRDRINTMRKRAKERISQKNAEISKLKEEVKRKYDLIVDYQEKIKRLEKIAKYARELREEKDRLKRMIDELEIRLKEKEIEIEKMKEIAPYRDEEHYGDLSYWTGKRLYEMKQKFPKLSYRKMEEVTGISKSTIQKRISKYMEQIDNL